MQIIPKSELNARIDRWGKRGQKWAQEGQELALSCLQHLADHGDIGFCNRLYLSMPKGTKSSAMASWLLTYGQLEANTDKATKASAPFKFSREKATDVEGAAADPWFEHKPEPSADQVFDLQKALAAVLRKASKASHVEHSELLEGLMALVGGENDSPVEDLEESEF